jgi:hypothetical protein
MKRIFVLPLAITLTAGLACLRGVEPQKVADAILDPNTPEDRRSQLIRDHLGQAPEIILAMTNDLASGAEEYRRIPYIWRVSISAARKDETPVVRRLLDLSLPGDGAPLRDWQAVVLGGGIINGWSLEGKWPAQRLREAVGDDENLLRRVRRATEDAHRIADDTKIPTGTRYDALRILALDSWEQSGKHILQYLTKDTHSELQMGAVSSLSDMNYPESAQALIEALKILTPDNRRLAIEALLRTPDRKELLRMSLKQGKIAYEWLTEAQRKALIP